MSDPLNCENGTDVLLAFLYARGSRAKHGDGIDGFTRLDKLMWLLKNTEEFRNLVDFEFDQDRFGPLSVELFDTLEALIYAGLIFVANERTAKNSIDVMDEMMITNEVSEFLLSKDFFPVKEYRLSYKGLPVARVLYNSLSENQKRKLAYIKMVVGKVSQGHLFNYVYSRPEMR